MEYLLLTFIALTGTIHIAAYYVHKPFLRLIFKPLTTLLVLVLAWLQPAFSDESYRFLIMAGLILSLLGDVMLVLPKEQFIAGLIFFFIAHLVFIAAFSLDLGFQWNVLMLFISATVLTPYLWVLLHHTKEMTMPVAAYGVVLLVLLWQTLSRFWYLGDNRSLLVFLGAVLFIFSDALLAYDKFVKKIKPAEVLLMVSYWMALILFAFSI